MSGLKDGEDAHSPADSHDRLRQAFAGVRALLLDMDGVVMLRGRPLPGAGDAVARLASRGIPFRFVTNSSLHDRETLSRMLTAAGIAVGASDIVTALSASALLAIRKWPGEELYVLAADEGLREFEGQRLLADEQAAAASRDGASGSRVAAVIVGDAGPGFTFARLNTAFRLVRAGARLVAVHRNRWWLTPDGITLDSGAFVRAIEYAAGRRALLVGKPAPSFFEAALESLGLPAEAPDVPGAWERRTVLMVGDDLLTDVAAARRVGLRGAFVLSGKHGAADLAAARRNAGSSAPGDVFLPDAVAPSLSEIVAALD